ncbi:MAG: SAM-dependent methyltransferase [Muribaculaceae bacterium]
MIESALYLIPVPLSDGAVENVLPASNLALVGEIKHFVVENVRSARRFLKKCDRSINIDELTFYELNRHTDPNAIADYLQPLERGEAMGVISEAGCPAIADPGADVVAIAQRKGLKVRPLVGPSSILMGLMGSGFNGQSFAFLGYLPIDQGERARKFKEMERLIRNDNQTQIFIETPYRNNKLMAEMCKQLPGNLALCVATDITGAGEKIVTKTVREWAHTKYDFDKVPTIFLLYK